MVPVLSKYLTTGRITDHSILSAHEWRGSMWPVDDLGWVSTKHKSMEACALNLLQDRYSGKRLAITRSRW